MLHYRLKRNADTVTAMETAMETENLSGPSAPSANATSVTYRDSFGGPGAMSLDEYMNDQRAADEQGIEEAMNEERNGAVASRRARF